jgi:hypothetical protein
MRVRMCYLYVREIKGHRLITQGCTPMFTRWTVNRLRLTQSIRQVGQFVRVYIRDSAKSAG